MLILIIKGTIFSIDFLLLLDMNDWPGSLRITYMTGPNIGQRKRRREQACIVSSRMRKKGTKLGTGLATDAKRYAKKKKRKKNRDTVDAYVNVFHYARWL